VSGKWGRGKVAKSGEIKLGVEYITRLKHETGTNKKRM
jgi:hypothetical protein